MSAVLMICFARSGGTVLNRCLACLPNVFVLSEVNPLGGGGGQPGPPVADIQRQAQEWFGLRVAGNSYAETIVDLFAKAAQKGCQIVVRDWTYVNFFPCEQNRNAPPYQFLAYEQLASSLEVKPFAMTRDAIDVWISRKMPPAKEFFPHYLRYAEQLVGEKFPRFRYEDFCADPATVLQAICGVTGLTYSEGWKNFPTFTNVYGDSDPGKQSRGFSESEIVALPRKKIGWLKVKEVNGCEEMVEANRLLGYPTEY